MCVIHDALSSGRRSQRTYLASVTTPVEPAPPAPYDPEMKAAGQLTSPTWELELFLSGAFVFASFQLPGVIESVFRRMEPHVTESMTLTMIVGSLYAKAIAFTLIATFLVHLVSRAHWVALLGLYSVFPRGIRWEEMKIGPISKDVYQASMPDLGRVVAKLDNFCSIVFSAGLLIVVVFAYSTVLIGAMSGLSFLLSLALFQGRNTQRVLWVIGTIFVLIPLSATLIDKAFGSRIPRESSAYRVVRAMIRFAFTLNMMRLTGPMMWTLATNMGTSVRSRCCTSRCLA